MGGETIYVVEPQGDGWIVRLAGHEPIRFEGDFHDAWAHAEGLAKGDGQARVLALNDRGEAVAEARS